MTIRRNRGQAATPGSSGIVEIAEIANPGVGSAWADISADVYADADWLEVQLVEDASDRRPFDIGPLQFENWSTVYIADRQHDGVPDTVGSASSLSLSSGWTLYATGISFPSKTANDFYRIRFKKGATIFWITISGTSVAALTEKSAGDNNSNTNQYGFLDGNQDRVMYVSRTSSDELLIGINVAGTTWDAMVYQMFEFGEMRIRKKRIQVAVST